MPRSATPKTPTTKKVKKDYGFVHADYAEGDLSSYRGIVMEYTDAKGVPQEERFYLSPLQAGYDPQTAYAAEREAVELRRQELGMDVIYLSSYDHYSQDIDPELQAEMAELEAHDQAALCMTSMTCGLIAVVAYRLDMQIGDFNVSVDDGRSSYSSDIIQAIIQTGDLESSTNDDLRKYGLLLASAGDSTDGECKNVGLELARRNCPIPATLSALEGHWFHHQVVIHWYAELLIEVLQIEDTCHYAVAAVAAVLMDTGEITGEDAQSIVTLAHNGYKVRAAAKAEEFPCPH